MSPTEALQKLIEYIPIDSMRREVGQAVAKAPQAYRDALKQLTSKDAQNMRPWWKI